MKFFNGLLGASFMFLFACDATNLNSLSSHTKNIFNNFTKNEIKTSNGHTSDVAEIKTIELSKIIDTTPASENFGRNFQEALRLSVESDPEVLSSKANYQARLASIDLAESSKEFKFSGTLLGGVEDLSEETAGVVALINGKKLIYDGGKIDSQISKERYLASAALAEYKVKQNQSYFNALSAWVNINRHTALTELIQSRLEVLAPLIQQLEKVAKAGVGDASQVAAAERTVNMIRAVERVVSQDLAQAEVAFENIFGVISPRHTFQARLIKGAVPPSDITEFIKSAPLVSLNYARYGAAVANLNSVIAKDSYDVGFEAKIQKPFGGSGYDSDESIGFVIAKTLGDGGSIKAEKRVSEAQVAASLDMLRSSLRSTEKTIKEAQKAISSIKQAMELANTNALNAKDEISYLRQQLVIGQSTLDSVLSAEARLYEAEAKSINLISDQYIAEVTILSALGLLAPLFEAK